jgi:hypothetical protein
MRDQIVELSTQQALIVNEDDLEFICGLQMLMEMEEPLDVQHVDRVEKIYAQALRNADAWR